MYRSIVLLAIAGLIITQAAFGQKNYLGYYDLINEAEQQFVVNGDKVKCYELYDSAFSVYDKPFVKDIFIAAQIAYSNADTSRFLNYIAKCFDAGMTFQCLHDPQLFDPVLKNTNLLSRLSTLFEGRKKPIIDSLVMDSVYMRFYLMESVKLSMGRDNARISQYQLMEKSNTEYYTSFFKENIFPSDQLIGLYTDDGFAAFLEKYHLVPFETPNQNSIPQLNRKVILTPIPYDYGLWNQAAFVSYIHYPCAFVSHKDEFWQGVVNGYVHPKDYAMLEEVAAKSANVPGFLQDCTIGQQSCYYNVIGSLSVSDPDLIKEVETHRAAKHLQKYSVDVLKKKLQEEKGFDFFFGFFDFR